MDEWRVAEQARFQASWEQARFMAFAAIAPHSKKVRKPESLMRFPWEGAKAPQPPQGGEDSEKVLTKEERRARMKELAAMWK
jgi:hypothetical protein